MHRKGDPIWLKQFYFAIPAPCILLIKSQSKAIVYLPPTVQRDHLAFSLDMYSYRNFLFVCVCFEDNILWLWLYRGGSRSAAVDSVFSM